GAEFLDQLLMAGGRVVRQRGLSVRGGQRAHFGVAAVGGHAGARGEPGQRRQNKKSRRHCVLLGKGKSAAQGKAPPVLREAVDRGSQRFGAVGRRRPQRRKAGRDRRRRERRQPRQRRRERRGAAQAAAVALAVPAAGGVDGSLLLGGCAFMAAVVDAGVSVHGGRRRRRHGRQRQRCLQQ